jgi:tetratricopeptide (TPR) repeat protein
VAGLITVLDTEGKTEECLRKAREFFKMIPSDRLRAKVLCTLARRHSMSGNLDKATECAKNAIEAGERCGEKSEIAKACAYLAGTLARMGHIREALTYGGRGYDIAEELGSERLLGLTLNALALVTAMDGNLQEAKRLFEETAQADEKTGYLHSAALARLNVAAAMSEMGECEEALERYREAIGLFEKMGALQSAAAAKYNAAATFIDLGEYRSGFSMLQDAFSLFRKTKSTSGMGRSFVLMASFLLKMGRIDEALSVLEKGWRILMEEGHRTYKAFVLETRIECAILSEKIQKALDESKAFLEEAMQGEAKGDYHSALLIRLRVLLTTGHLSEAQNIANRMVKAGFSEQNPTAESSFKVALAHLAAMKGDFKKAENLFEEVLSTGRLNREACAEAYLSFGEAMLNAGRSQKAKPYLTKAREKYSVLVAGGYREHELNRIQELLTKL